MQDLGRSHAVFVSIAYFVIEATQNWKTQKSGSVCYYHKLISFLFLRPIVDVVYRPWKKNRYSLISFSKFGSSSSDSSIAFDVQSQPRSNRHSCMTILPSSLSPSGVKSVSSRTEVASEISHKDGLSDLAPPKDHDIVSSENYLQLGMQYHERGELEKATQYWRLAAKEEQPLGLFFYGIALRHGWGCQKDPAVAVQYLQKAAECAVYDLQTGISTAALVAKSELVLAIHELGVCFRHGWGVPKNVVSAAYYFEIAANLGDPDAQNELAFCYAHGQGVKKDVFKAAKYYRMAHRQGQGLVGNSWIWKEKYDVVDD
ncbi:uncharacterized protein BYT42DRAFT_551518 [Radiomyces spectabilis]|uniref:uncharacterized protein n=1 Tax=Radiomyces spectabilis TaxID=64574 RepID=UPI00221E9EDB|nr:uncharacterized protein BYT42DRAFT_551518 [Radiomyces spectabilis]KAI8393574.1 hypothetical protein BYT42DRAFT_551518 [Radiomyces spectabilis]